MSEDQAIFSTLEIDTIGEIMNISMGSAATAASTLLDNKVTITTPVVNLVETDKFEITQFEPAIAVDIRYVEGISGSNILILRKADVRTILSQMMMTEIPENFDIDEMAESAICELMNQMMGSSATVLSCFLGRTINISTPQTVAIDRLDEFKQEHFGGSSSILTIEFTITIKDIMESKFVSAMDVDLAKEIIDVSLNFDAGGESEDQTETAPPQMSSPPPVAAAAPQPAPAAAQPQQPAQQAAPPQYQAPVQQAPPPVYPQPDPNMAAQQQQAYPGYPPQGYYPPPQGYYPPPQGYYPPQQSPIKVQDYDYGDFGTGNGMSSEQTTNMDLVMNVPVVVTVELGRTKRKIKEILEFGQGTIVELDKQAGSQVDVIVNGELIAHGDVVVVDDNFSIRITEILKNRDSIAIT
ncbi:MAG: flagellar motor switch phosphatase FliY [Oscillospiraceae bacterium]|jgi:flagellar motor switch protein FliN/FliY|nr:flagellar motor switch phosphatase FliY [Oscillospiraceae bacterium]